MKALERGPMRFDNEKSLLKDPYGLVNILNLKKPARRDIQRSIGSIAMTDRI